MHLESIVRVYERLRLTTKKLEKIEEVARLLGESPKEDLPFVCRMLAGKVFPDWLQLELGIGGAMLWESICEVAGIDSQELANAYDEKGDLGEAAELMLERKPRIRLIEKPLELREVYDAFQSIARLRGRGSARRKKELLKGLLNRASPSEAKLLIKVITGDLRAGFKEGLLEESLANAFKAPLDEIRKARMLISDLGEVAMALKERGREGLREFSIRIGRPIKHMLASIATSLQEGIERYGAAIFECKYDGSRVQVHKQTSLKIFTRRFEDITNSLPEIASELSQVKGSFILDGELIPFDEGPKPFQELIRRLRRKHEVERFVRAIPVKLYVFDLLYLDGRQLIDLPLLKRKKLLEGLLKPSEHVDIARYILTSDLGEARGFFKRVVEEGYEGVLIKDPASSYKPGERGKHWLKFKPRPESLDLVVVAVEYGHGKRARLLSDYTFALRDEKGELVPIAKAYCGLTDKEIEEMTAYFKSIALRRTGRKLFVRPNVIVEVEFGEIQRSPHYPLGFALRFPRIKRIRWDKSLEDIDDIKRVREIFVKQRRYRG